MYKLRRGVPRDYKEALKWYQKAADLGNADAQYWLGNMYYFGEGVLEDSKEAAKWFQKAADLGNSDAQYRLGDMYYLGEGVLEDSKEAAKWFQKAAEAGDADRLARERLARERLGEMYRDGEGVPQDNVLSYFWFSLSGRERDDSLRELEKRMTPEEIKEATFKAIAWLRKAAEAGDADARKRLGEMYRDGQGVPKDNVLSHFWLSVSRLYVRTELEELEKLMTPAQIKEAQSEAKQRFEEMKRK
jgi:TPR repeat protein